MCHSLANASGYIWLRPKADLGKNPNFSATNPEGLSKTRAAFSPVILTLPLWEGFLSPE